MLKQELDYEGSAEHGIGDTSDDDTDTRRLKFLRGRKASQLTDAEKKEKLRLQNRESARKLRRRRTAQMETLQEEVQRLTRENEALVTRMTEIGELYRGLEKEVLALRSDNQRLRLGSQQPRQAPSRRTTVTYIQSPSDPMREPLQRLDLRDPTSPNMHHLSHPSARPTTPSKALPNTLGHSQLPHLQAAHSQDYALLSRHNSSDNPMDPLPHYQLEHQQALLAGRAPRHPQLLVAAQQQRQADAAAIVHLQAGHSSADGLSPARSLPNPSSRMSISKASSGGLPALDGSGMVLQDGSRKEGMSEAMLPMSQAGKTYQWLGDGQASDAPHLGLMPQRFPNTFN